MLATELKCWRRKMSVDKTAFDGLFEKSTDDYDLTENFGFFVEGYIFTPEDTQESYNRELWKLPTLIRRLYLAYIVQILVDHGGFQNYFKGMDDEGLIDETTAGLRLLSRNKSADAYELARGYAPFRSFDERHCVTDEEGGRIFLDFSDNFGADYWNDLGRFLRENRHSALQHGR